jgi:dipeptidyl aminopeptidase/acylaminoacyl peptidase
MRRATAWLETRPEVDRQRLGIMGTSLGSFMGALTAEMEPKLSRVALLLGGGGLIEAFYDRQEVWPIRLAWEALGGSREKLAAKLACADPLTCAENLKGRKLLLIGAKRDEIVPPSALERLWKATGQPKILWYDCTHEGAILYVVPAMQEIVTHFGAP